MKKIVAIVFSLTVAVNFGKAQKNNVLFSVGPAILIPSYSGINSNGFGVGASFEYVLTKKVSIASDIDINFFTSNIKNVFTHKVTNGFAIMPVLAGVKWGAVKNIYLSGKAGMAVGLKNAGTNLTLSPGIGYLFNIKGKQKIDMGIRLIGVLPKASLPENTFLEKGGYSFLAFKLAYQF